MLGGGGGGASGKVSLSALQKRRFGKPKFRSRISENNKEVEHVRTTWYDRKRNPSFAGKWMASAAIRIDLPRNSSILARVAVVL